MNIFQEEQVWFRVLVVKGGDVKIRPSISVHIAPGRTVALDRGPLGKKSSRFADIGETKVRLLTQGENDWKQAK